MLFFLGQDRSYLSEEAKPNGLLRVVCVGDSMTYGQGCLSTETFPFQLERTLNAVLWKQQVEVINGGVCGYSIHDAWNRYLDKFVHFRPDLVILTVCDNDAELYNHREATIEQVKRMTYVEFSEACYDPNGEHFPYFCLLLRDIAEYVCSGGPPVLVSFYDIHGGQHRERLMPRVRDACYAAEVPFADLSQDFLDTAAATHNKMLKVSDVDAHPSPIAHGIAARRLARTILEHNLLPQSSETISPESDIVRECFMRTDRMVQSGSNAGKAFFFLKRSLAAKRDSRVRMRLTKDNLLDDVSYQKLLDCLDQTWRCFITLSVWESYYAGFRADIDQFNFGMSLCDMAMARLAKTLFVLRKRLADLSLPLVDEFQKISKQEAISDGQDFHAIVKKLSSWQQKHLRLQEFATQTFQLSREAESPLSFSAGLLATRLESLERQVMPLWREVEAILATSDKHLTCYMTLAEQVAQQENDDLVQTLNRAYWLLEETVNHVDFCLTAVRHDNLALLARASEHEIRSCLTSLQVTVTAPEHRRTFSNEEPLSLEVWVKSFAPFGRVVSDIHTILRDGMPHMYRFELPFFVDAELRLGIKGGQDVEIGVVRIFNAEDRHITLSPANFTVENDRQIYRVDRVFVPL
jgi:hypothetical protein